MAAYSSRQLLKERYCIFDKIGEGGMGVVYKAMDTHLGGRLVAIKEMTQLAQDEQIVTAFQKEARLLASLQHPSLPAVYDHFAENGNWYLVMSFIEGEPLEQRLPASSQQGLSLEEVLRIGQQVCSVLEYLHGQQPPIIFRDLKPANIMRTPKGHIYLIDFGIARLFKPGQSKDTNTLGTEGYAAPEQYGKEQTSTRSDIYSLGVTLHELLTGDDPSQTPFHFTRLRTPDFPAELDTLLQHMLALTPEKRPASVAEVSQKLQEIAEEQSKTLSGAQVPQIKLGKPVARPLRPPPPTGTVLCVFAGHADQVTSVAWSPNGKSIASGSRDGTVCIWDAVKGNVQLTYRQQSAGVTCLAWSANGSYIASGSNDRTIHVWDATTGETLSQYHGHNRLWAGGHAIKGLSWSPDSKKIASVSGDYSVQVWEASSGESTLVYSKHGNQFPVYCVAWSPDGKHVASVAGESHVWNAATGNTQVVNRFCRPTTISWSMDSKFIASVCPGQGRKQGATVHIWEMSTGRQYQTSRNQKEPVSVLAWSPNNRSLALAHKNVCIWDVATKQTVYTYNGHASPVSSLAWSPESSRIASGSVDTTVQVWVASV